jgi:hypothetical protein
MSADAVLRRHRRAIRRLAAWHGAGNGHMSTRHAH